MQTQTESYLFDSLKKLMNEGGDNNFIIINIDNDFFLQVAGEKGSTDLLCEAVSDEFLPQNRNLSSKQKIVLAQLGWYEPDEFTPNYNFDIEVKSDIDLNDTVKLLLTTARDVFKATTLNLEMINVNLE